MSISMRQESAGPVREQSARRLFKECFSRPIYLILTCDVMIVFVSFYVGIFVRWGELDDFAASVSVHLEEAVIFAALLILSMFSAGLYYGRLETRGVQIALRLVASLALTFFGLAVILYAFPDLTIWRSALLIAMVSAFLGTLSLRMLAPNFVDVESLKPRVMVLGTGDQARRIEDLQRQGHPFGFTCLGYLGVDGEPCAVPPSRILAGKDALGQLARDLEVSEVVIAVRERRGQIPLQALLKCRLSGVRIYDYITFREKETGSVDLEEVKPSWFIFADGFPGGMLHQILKRGFDIVVSFIFLILFMPLMIATALAIRVEGPGRILHRQERVGLEGRPFVLIKFRSMVENAERDGIPQWAATGDSRVTTVGALIRKLRIDELPQLLNVLKGDMSFVGPRPERPYFVKELSEELPYYEERHRVKPGITGWAQLNYDYGSSIEDARHKLEYDLYYVKKYSVLLDITIVLQTVRVIIWPSGAR